MMKTKLSRILTLLLAFVVQFTFAQERTITGTVSDETGPLPGVSVLIEGTTIGTESDFDGNYSLEAKSGDVIRYSFVGMTTVKKTVGAESSINITMVSEENTLDEVVVTALGITREKKSLGYATQEVDGEAINTVKDPNFVNSLSGKVAGIDVKSSGTMGGSSNVIIRGYSSLTGNNQALFVVDGIPIGNGNTNGGTQQAGGGGYDYGNGAQDINPDDIESVNVLKGGAATALYGSRAANGVIIITTKKGKRRENDAIGITINSSVTFNKYNKETFAEYQNEYGAGYFDPWHPGGFYFDDQNGDGVDERYALSDWDGSFGIVPFDENLLVHQWDSWFPQLTDTYNVATPWVGAGADGPQTLFQTGHQMFNSVSIDGATDKGNFRLGYSNLSQAGILPNSEINRNNIDVGASYKLNEKLTASFKGQFIQTKGKGRYGTGYDSGNPMQSMKQWWQTNVNVRDQKATYFQTRTNTTWNTSYINYDLSPIYTDNVYWTRYENYENDNRDRIIGNIMLEYQANDWLGFMGRVTMDNYNEAQHERINVGSVDVSKYSRYNNFYNENNYDFLALIKKNWENISLNATLGTNIRRTSRNSIYAQTNGGLILPSLYSLENSLNPINAPTESEWNAGVDGIFATASIGFNNILYVEGSVRRDKFSTLPRDNDEAIYWGVSGSFLFSSLFDSNWLSLGKLRAGYATTGNGAGVYATSNYFSLGTPIGGQPIANTPFTNANTDLKPETSTEFEVGVELSLFKNRLGLDFSYYDKKSVDLISPLTISTSTGFGRQQLNAGEVSNVGMELNLFGSPVKNENFEWRVDLNWAQNKNEVLSLPGGLTNILLASVQGGVSINATVGEPYGQIRGTDFVIDEASGQRTILTNGAYAKTASTNENLGSYLPDWRAGLNNRFTYKGIALSVLIDMQKGGSVFSLDQWYGQATGLYPNTAGLNELGNPKRDPLTDGPDSGGILLEGVQADGTVNTTRARFDYFAHALGYSKAPNALHVYDAGFIKLREVSLAYSLPQKLFTSKGMVKGMTFTALGRNLWIIDKELPYADPEAGLSSGNIQGNQSGAYPTTKDIGFSVKIEF